MIESTENSPWWSHALFVAVGLGLWCWTQNLIGEQQHEQVALV